MPYGDPEPDDPSGRATAHRLAGPDSQGCPAVPLRHRPARHPRPHPAPTSRYIAGPAAPGRRTPPAPRLGRSDDHESAVYTANSGTKRLRLEGVPVSCVCRDSIPALTNSGRMSGALRGFEVASEASSRATVTPDLLPTSSTWRTCKGQAGRRAGTGIAAGGHIRRVLGRRQRRLLAREYRDLTVVTIAAIGEQLAPRFRRTRPSVKTLIIATRRDQASIETGESEAPHTYVSLPATGQPS